MGVLWSVRRPPVDHPWATGRPPVDHPWATGRPPVGRPVGRCGTDAPFSFLVQSPKVMKMGASPPPGRGSWDSEAVEARAEAMVATYETVLIGAQRRAGNCRLCFSRLSGYA